MSYVGIFVKHTLRKFRKPEQREYTTLKLPMGRVSLAMSWRSGSFQLKTVANKKVEIP